MLANSLSETTLSAKISVVSLVVLAHISGLYKLAHLETATTMAVQKENPPLIVAVLPQEHTVHTHAPTPMAVISGVNKAQNPSHTWHNSFASEPNRSLFTRMKPINHVRVIPAKAGIQAVSDAHRLLDSGFRRNDEQNSSPHQQQTEEKSIPTLLSTQSTRTSPTHEEKGEESPHHSEVGYLHHPKPPYPPSARRLNMQGTVVVRIIVSSEGLAQSADIHKSSGYDVLDQAALNAIKTWTFIPAKMGQKPVEHAVDIPWKFSLDEE